MAQGSPDAVHLGVAVMIWRGHRLLLGQRLQADPVCWQFPGGRMEAGESVFDCARREVQEETGLRLCACRSAGYSLHTACIGGRDYVTLYVSAIAEAGEPRSLEPDKAANWQWFDVACLPSPLFEPVKRYIAQHGELGAFHFDAPSFPDTRADGRR